MDEEFFGGVAYADALGFGVDEDGDGFVGVAGAVDVNVHVAGSGFDDGDFGVAYHGLMSPAPRAGMSTSMWPRASIMAVAPSRPYWSTVAIMLWSYPCLVSTSAMTASVAALVCSAACPPRSRTALPDLMHREATSTVTLGRAS